MESLETKESKVFTPVYFTSRQILLPLKMISYVSRFLKFEDFRKFIRAMWPNGEANVIFQELLERLSIRKFKAKFYNREEIEVEYKFDRERSGINWILINFKDLLPILGGIMLPDDEDKFQSIFTLEDFLKRNLKVHRCSGGIHTSCHNLGRDSDSDSEAKLDICPFDHYHHFCPDHVIAWFKHYLLTAILLREGVYDELVKNANLPNADHLTSGRRRTEQYWLRVARRKKCRFSQ
uniref:Repeat element protein n=2 Tax=Campoletis sonorensis ichnovirus TaxID=10484 RepID=REEP_CSIV|nr:RecName: Full=Repeat element protein [Ichnoviriform sonorense]AAA42923.1 repeat element protein [Ichnoviriform sonorense]AAL55036.1 repeat element protein [Ichnoviriform sonorense]